MYFYHSTPLRLTLAQTLELRCKFTFAVSAIRFLENKCDLRSTVVGFDQFAEVKMTTQRP